MNKIAVITASIGSLDLYNPIEFHDTVDYHAFVKGPAVHKKDGWIRHEAPNFSVDNHYKNRRDAKLPKVLPQLVLPGYDYYVWIDCTNKLVVNPKVMIDKYLIEHDIAGFLHDRKCVYEEIDICKSHKLDHKNRLDKTEEFLKNNKFPTKMRFTENTCRIQRNTPTINNMCLMWWDLICQFSSRDQLTLPFALWKNKVEINLMPGKAQGNNPYMPLFKYGTHVRKINK